jgi:hypothetical protein
MEEFHHKDKHFKKETIPWADFASFVKKSLEFIEVYTGEKSELIIEPKGSVQEISITVFTKENKDQSMNTSIKAYCDDGVTKVLRCTGEMNSILTITSRRKKRRIEIKSTGDLLDYLILHLSPELIHIRSAMYTISILNIFQSMKIQMNFVNDPLQSRPFLYILNPAQKTSVRISYNQESRSICIENEERKQILPPLKKEKPLNISKDHVLLEESFANNANKTISRHPNTSFSIDLILKLLNVSYSSFESRPKNIIGG